MDKVIVSKPKKQDATYISSLTLKQAPLKFEIAKALITHVKPLQTRNENMLTLKVNSGLIKTFAALNHHILEIVKDKAQLWFKNNLNIDLVEDYFSNLVHFDKKYGDVLKLKIISSDDEQLKAFLAQNVAINIVANHIRFYKQKFIVEFSVESMTLCKSILQDSFFEGEEEEEEDLPFPSCDVILNMKEESLASLKMLKTKICEFEKELQGTNDLKLILQICDNLDFFMLQYNKWPTS
jgi:hypothetical protein